MASDPLNIHEDKNVQFLFLFTNANEFYISARQNLNSGLVIVGCSNAHQAIELYIKSIIKLDYEEKWGHHLDELIKEFKHKEIYFNELLENQNTLKFLKELSKAYIMLRYGEAGFNVNSHEIIQLLDEIVYKLRKIYLTNIKAPSSKLYIPKDLQATFLKENRFFKVTEITHNPLALMGLFITDEIPEVLQDL